MGTICLLAIGLGCSLFRCVEGITQFRKGKQTAMYLCDPDVEQLEQGKKNSLP